MDLAGVDADFRIPGVEYRPEHRLGDRYSVELHRLRTASSDFVDGSLLYRSLVAKRLDEMSTWIAAEWSDAEILRRFRGPVEGITFSNSVPTAAVHTALKYQSARIPSTGTDSRTGLTSTTLRFPSRTRTPSGAMPIGLISRGPLGWTPPLTPG